MFCKYLKLFLIVFLLLVGLSGVVYADESITMRIAHAHTIDHLRHQALIRFQQSLEEKAPEVELIIYPAGQLGTEREMMESTKLGSIEGCMSGSYESYHKELMALTLPYLFDSLDEAKSVLNGDVGDYLSKIGDRLTILTWQHSSGFRHIINNNRPIETPSDLKGLKVRVPPIETSKLTIEAFGASPTPVAWAETYLAVKTKVVDGVENAIEHLYTGKTYEVAKYLSLTGHIYHPQPIFINKAWWDSLPSELRTIINDCAHEAATWHDSQIVSSEETKLKEMIEYGVEVNEVTDQNKLLFREKSEQVYKYYIDEGIFSEELKNKLEEALGRNIM